MNAKQGFLCLIIGMMALTLNHIAISCREKMDHEYEEEYYNENPHIKRVERVDTIKIDTIDFRMENDLDLGISTSGKIGVGLTDELILTEDGVRVTLFEF